MALNTARYREAEQRLWTSLGLTPIEHRVALASGSTVRVQEVGEGPPVMLVHGTGSSGANWAPLLAELDGFRCIAIDRPGCGLSDVGTSGRSGSIEAFNAAADGLITDIFDALSLERAPVIATSYGGYFAVRAAAAHQDRIEKLVLIAYVFGAPMTAVPLSMRFAAIPGLGELTTKIPPTKAAVRMILRQIGLGRALESGRFSEEMFDWFFALLRDTDTMANEQRSAPKLLTPIRGQNPAIVFRPEVIEQVRMPVRFIWGDEDPMAGPEVATAFAARFPDATLELLDDAGHAPWIDEPQRTAELTRSFLEP